MNCNAFSHKFKQMCSTIGLNRGFRLIKWIFYYRNKWSNCEPDNFGRVGLLTVVVTSELLYLYYVDKLTSIRYAKTIKFPLHRQ